MKFLYLVSFLTLVLCSFLNIAGSTVNTAYWAIQLGEATAESYEEILSTEGSDTFFGTFIDKNKNFYGVGRTKGSLLEKQGGLGDAFIARFNSEGKITLAKQFGYETKVTFDDFGDNSQSDVFNSVSVDDSGNIYVVGYTEGSWAEENGGEKDAIIASFDPEGNTRWVKQFGKKTKINLDGDNSQSDVFNSISIDDSENIYVVGYTEGSWAEENGGEKDAIIVSFDSAGNTRWIKQFGSKTKADSNGNNYYEEYFENVAVDNSGNIYAVGSTHSSWVEKKSYRSDGIIISFDSEGNKRWAKQFGSKTKADPNGGNGYQDYFEDVAVDSSKNVYVVGYTQGSWAERNGGDFDGIIISFDSEGNKRWAKQFGNETKAGSNGDNRSTEYFESIAVDNSGSVYVAGYVYGSWGEKKGGKSDGIILSLKSEDGDVNWAYQFGNRTRMVSNSSGVGHDDVFDLLVQRTNNSSYEYFLDIFVLDSENRVFVGHTEGSWAEVREKNGDADAIMVNF